MQCAPQRADDVRCGTFTLQKHDKICQNLHIVDKSVVSIPTTSTENLLMIVKDERAKVAAIV